MPAGAPFQDLKSFNWLFLFFNTAFFIFLVAELLPLCVFETQNDSRTTREQSGSRTPGVH